MSTRPPLREVSLSPLPSIPRRPKRRSAFAQEYLSAASGEATVRRAVSAKFASLDRRDQILACVRLARRRGLDFLVLDQTRPEVQVPVVRVIVPGLRPFRCR
jgi:hypothetical protein